MATSPAPPPGYTLDAPSGGTSSTPPPPPGYSLDQPDQSNQFGFSSTPQPYHASPTLPENLPETMGKAAIKLLPAAGATAATVMSGGTALPLLGAMAASGFGGAAGSAVQQGIEKATGMPEAPNSFSDFAKRAGIEGLIQGGSEGVGRAITGAVSKAFGRMVDSKQLYQSALMPSTTKGIKGVDKVVNAGLENRIPVSAEGQVQAHQAWKDLNATIDQIVQSNPQRAVDPKVIVQRLNDLRTKWTQGTGDPAYLHAINDVENNFLARHPNPMTGADAQATKKAIYNEVRGAKQNAYAPNTVAPNPLTVQSKQEIASGLRDELIKLHPQIEGLAKKEGGLIELDHALDRVVVKEGNKRITPYFAPILAAASAAGFGTGHAGIGAGMGGAAAVMGAHYLRAAMEDPQVKSQLAILLNRAGKTAVGKVVKATAPYAPQTAIRLGAAGAQSLGSDSAELPQPPQ